MKTDYKIILWIDGKPTELHTLELNSDEAGWYTSITSIQAFSKRENERLFKNNLAGKSFTPGKRCHVTWGTGSTSTFFSQRDRGLSLFKHPSVWDFYKAVGYDYKKQKYIKNAET